MPYLARRELFTLDTIHEQGIRMIRKAQLAIVALGIALVPLGVRAKSSVVGIVFFTEWSALMNDTALSIIKSSADTVDAGDKRSSVVVTGYADTTGSAEANKLLSATRAQVVIDQLCADGVALNRIKRVSKGITPDIGGKNESRRVIINIE